MADRTGIFNTEKEFTNEVPTQPIRSQVSQRVHMSSPIELTPAGLEAIETQPSDGKASLSTNWEASGALSRFREWRTLQQDLRSLPATAEQNHQSILDALSKYRLTVIGLSYKAKIIDDEIWNLYNEILPEIPILTKEIRKRPLFLRSKAWLFAQKQLWRELINKQENLLGLIDKAPKILEFYNKVHIARGHRLQQRAQEAENAQKIAEARKSLASAIQYIQELDNQGEQITYGSKLISLEEAQITWGKKLNEFSQLDKSQLVNADQVLVKMYQLEKMVRDAPVSARWVRTVEERFANLLSSHDMLVQFGKSVIPQKELARTTVIMYEKIPEYWVNGNREELDRNLQGLESFISYYETRVQTEIAIAERHRPGLSQSFASGPGEEKSILPPLIVMARAFTNAIDSRDRFMRDHSTKVGRLAVQIGRRMNWSESELEQLEIAGLLHDIGKLSVPEAILTKTQPLNSDDWKVIHKHPYFGAQIVKSMGILGRIVPWIYHHQEKWDGSGYPDHIVKREIPMASTIISLAEAYTVMTIDMPNRDSLTEEQAAERVREESGSQFNPEVVEAFEDVIKE